MAKYDPLEMHLLCLPASQAELTLSFSEVESIIGEKLPPSAYKYRAWWSNGKGSRHVNAHAWRDVGWKVDAVDQAAGWVRFVRQ